MLRVRLEGLARDKRASLFCVSDEKKSFQTMILGRPLRIRRVDQVLKQLTFLKSSVFLRKNKLECLSLTIILYNNEFRFSYGYYL
jgi:hypothetical protein